MNDDTNIEPVDLSPTRAELIARVRARGRQIRARRRLAITGLTALVVLAIAVPAIAIGAGSSSHGVTPATVVHRTGDFRIAVVVQTSSPPCKPGTLPYNPSSVAPTQHPVSACLQLGAQIMNAADVRDASVVYDDTQGWIVNVEMSRAAVARLAAETNEQAAIIVGGRVVSAPVVQPGITGTTVTVSGGASTRAQAIALATKIAGGPPAHVEAAPALTAAIEVPVPTLVSGATAQETIVIVNHTDHAITLIAADGCPAVWQSELTVPGGPGFSVGSLRLRPPTCPKGVALAPGTNRVPLAVTARAQCFANADPNLGVPACLAGGEGPPLAPGVYEIRATANTPNTPFPTPAVVNVVAAH